MDIGINSYKEVEGPLGGLSVEYVIHVKTSHRAFKTNLQSDDVVVSFFVSKTFGELECLYKKLSKKYPSPNLPNITKQKSPFTENKDERRDLADRFVKFIASEPSLASSSIFVGFLDYHPSNPSVATEVTRDGIDRLAKTGRANKTDSHKIKSENIFTNDDEDDDDDIFKETDRPRVADSTPLFNRVPFSKETRKGDALMFASLDLSDDVEKRQDGIYVPSDEATNVEHGRVPSKAEDDAELLEIDSSLSDILGELELRSSKGKPPLLPKPSMVRGDEHQVSPVPRHRPKVTGDVASRPVPPPRTASVAAAVASRRPPVVARKGTAAPPPPRTKPNPSAADDDQALESVDILKYIQCEQDARNDDLNLF